MATGIKFETILSLRCIASIKVTISLWNRIQSYPSDSFRQLRRQWQEVENQIKINVSLLKLPTLSERHLKCLVKPIGVQILNWLEYHEENFRLFIGLIDRIYWTTRGDIDEGKTIGGLVKTDEIDAVTRYILASACCLENDIHALWDNMTDDERNRFLRSTNQDPLSVFWEFKMLGSGKAMNRLITSKIGHDRYSPYHFAFVIAVESGNATAAKYFWAKLSVEERSKSLVKNAIKTANRFNADMANGFNADIARCEPIKFQIYYGDVLCFLISQMNAKKLSRVLRMDPFGVLFGLAQWPFLDVLVQVLAFFLEKYQKKDFLHHSGLNDLFLRMINHGGAECENCVYKQIFTELWQVIPVKIKDIVLSDGRLLATLFECKDVKNLKLILGDASPKMKRNVLCSRRGAMICKDLVDVDDLDLLGLFLEECAASENDVIGLKEVISKFRGDAFVKVLGKLDTVWARLNGENDLSQ